MTFRDALRDCMTGQLHADDPYCEVCGITEAAFAVLNMPEMQAIKSALRVSADVNVVLAKDPDVPTSEVWMRDVWMLPESVIKWVLS